MQLQQLCSKRDFILSVTKCIIGVALPHICRSFELTMLVMAAFSRKATFYYLRSLLQLSLINPILHYYSFSNQ